MRRTALLLASSWLATGAVTASAQTAAQNTAPNPPAPYTSLSEIVVTAQKRSENIMIVPASVSAIGNVRLEALHATDLQDYAAYVPGLQVDSGGSPGQATITLRGIAPVGAGTEVGTYIDDVPLGSSGIYAIANLFQLDLLPYDLKDVEVLRGPQGTLYGATAMGGIIKYALQTPDTHQYHAAVGGDIMGIEKGGSAGGGLRAMVNLPLVEDKLAIRASAFYENTPGDIKDPVSHRNADNGVRQEGGRLALMWAPTNELKVQIDGFYQHIEADGDSEVALNPNTGKPLLGDLTNNFSLPQPFTQNVSLIKGSINYTLPFATLTSVTGYSRINSVQVQDDTPSFADVFSAFNGRAGYVPQTYNLTVHKFTEELRLASTANSHVEWLIGGFFTFERSANDQYAYSLGPNYQPLNAINPVVGAPLNPLLLASLPTRYVEKAVFGDLTFHVTDHWSFGGGLRYSYNNQSYTQTASGLLISNPGTDLPGLSSEAVLTYNVNTKYQFDSNNMVYGRIATGYQPGGPNIDLPGVPSTVRSSTLTNYEIGYKAKLLEQRLVLDVSAFRIDWLKIQVNATNPAGLQYFVNGGEAVSQGFEGSSQFRLTRDLTIGGTFDYTDARFSKNVRALDAGAGTSLPYVPQFSGSLTADYQHDVWGGWRGDFGGGVRLVGSRPNYLFATSSPPITFLEAGYAVLDLHAHATHGGWTVGLYAKNITDTRAYLTKTGIPDYLPAFLGSTTPVIDQVNATVLQPRTIGLSFDRHF